MNYIKFVIPVLLVFCVGLIYYQFFFFGKIPIPADLLVGAYYPWLDYKWGYEVGVPVKNPIITDVISQLYLWRSLAVEYLKQGIWPLWNPLSASGLPLLANYQSAPFLPFNILLFLPRDISWGFYIFLQSLLAALGMYFFVSVFKLNYFARFAASLIFAFSSLMATYVEFAMAGFAASMLPWIFLSIELYLKQKKARFLVLMTMFLTTLYLSGHAQLTLYSSILFVLFIFYNFFLKRVTKIELTNILIFFTLGIGLCALQLLPTIDYLLGSSIRTEETYSKLINYGLVPWYELIKIIAPDFFGNPTTYNYWGSYDYHESSSFLGTLTLPFLIPFLLIFRKIKDKNINFWILIFISSLLLTIQNPLTSFIYSLPIPFFTNSSISRLLFITCFSAAILFAYSLDRFSNDIKFRSQVWISSLICLSLVYLILLGSVIIVSWNLGLHIITDDLLKNLNVSIKNLIIPASILTALFILRFFKFKSWILFFLVMILFFDLGRYFIKHNPFTEKSLFYPKTPLIEFLQTKEPYFRIARADYEIMPPNTWMAYNLHSIEGYDPLSSENYSHFMNKVNNKKWDSGVSRYIEVKDYPSKFLDALNVKYLLAVKRDQDGKIPGEYLNEEIALTEYRKIYEDKNSVILENPNAQNRAYFVDQITWVKTLEDMVKVIDREDFDPTKEAVVLGDSQIVNTSSDGTIEFIEYSPTRIVIQTSVSKPTFLVLAETYDKGWRVFENGDKSNLYLANGALRGIMINTGKNKYELNYWPMSFDIGLKVTIFSLLVLFISIIYSVRLKKW